MEFLFMNKEQELNWIALNQSWNDEDTNEILPIEEDED